ncbi:TFIID-18kDa-domain-containing protein [Polyplosphaeria fusca]|uniref:Transcription initiation factor TFIID subunit 13 n=1 Tax=Polyplosphaeria fusca TaxID=682080 RepID=A0A9P4UUG4_9PLEO|nr:TFIID-18kDa-domain-containing protein [Polyplosphaeria fusca]
MTEPRMRLRQKGQQFPQNELAGFLLAFGDEADPLPETIRCLDEIVTDYIIESCHAAAATAHHARRAKIKLDDFKFMLRRDNSKLGRVSEMLETDKELKRKRRAFDTDEGKVATEAEAEGVGAAGAGGDKEKDGGKEDAEGGKKKKKRKMKKGGKKNGGEGENVV